MKVTRAGGAPPIPLRWAEMMRQIEDGLALRRPGAEYHLRTIPVGDSFILDLEVTQPPSVNVAIQMLPISAEDLEVDEQQRLRLVRGVIDGFLKQIAAACGKEVPRDSV